MPTMEPGDDAHSTTTHSTATGVLKLKHLTELTQEDDELLSLEETIEGLPDPIFDEEEVDGIPAWLVYYENIPLKPFRDKIRQLIRTEKYLYTLKVKDKQHKAS
jgi:hypothetical protein